MPGPGPLKLRAHDIEDLRALATCLQDALVPVADLAHLKAEKRFVMVANRFKWEGGAQTATQTATQTAPEPAPEPAPAAPEVAPELSGADRDSDARFEEADGGPLYQRVNCTVCFDWVRNIRFRGLDLGRKDQLLNLLTIEADPGAVTLLFSGGGEIRLEVSDIRCHLEDLGEPWPTRWRPDHAEAEPPSEPLPKLPPEPG